jgi:hypothetical protein
MKPCDRGLIFLLLVVLLAALVVGAQFYACERQAGFVVGHRYDITHGCQVLDRGQWVSIEEWKGRNGKP